MNKTEKQEADKTKTRGWFGLATHVFDLSKMAHSSGYSLFVHINLLLRLVPLC